MKLFDSEWKVMEVLWQKNDRTAKEISLRLADTIGWKLKRWSKKYLAVPRSCCLHRF